MSDALLGAALASLAGEAGGNSSEDSIDRDEIQGKYDAACASGRYDDMEKHLQALHRAACRAAAKIVRACIKAAQVPLDSLGTLARMLLADISNKCNDLAFLSKHLTLAYAQVIAHADLTATDERLYAVVVQDAQHDMAGARALAMTVHTQVLVGSTKERSGSSESGSPALAGLLASLMSHSKDNN